MLIDDISIAAVRKGRRKKERQGSVVSISIDDIDIVSRKERRY
jgi:hypothetical protein